MAVQQSIMGIACNSQNIHFPTIPGVEFISLNAKPVTNFSQYLPLGHYENHHAYNVTNVDFCNISLSYTHQGHDDVVNVQVWLPKDDWNSRIQGVGGGGFAAGLMSLSFSTMAGAVSQGYAAFSTDAGHDPVSRDPSEWAITQSGDLNMQLLKNFAYLSLQEAAIIGKSVTQSFYGQPAKYAYWNGCSTGGRQGLMLAQRYPDAFDGILASAPAINWSRFIVAELWPQLTMSLLNAYPKSCELEALTAAAIAECDSNDGVIDGVISDSDTCRFDPHKLVGQSINCSDTGSMVEISVAAAVVAQETWNGARGTDGSFLWYGLSHEAMLSGPYSLVGTNCDIDGRCAGQPFPIANNWVRVFVEQNVDFDIASATQADFESIFHKSHQEFETIISTNDPDLRPFHRAGGKMLTWHGLADEVIFPRGTRQYYDAVMAVDPSAQDYYRYFEAPGVNHCSGGPGAYPGKAMDSLVAWVEQGQVPTVLDAVSESRDDGVVNHRPLCPYPLVARYKGTGDTRASENFYCAESHLSTTPIARSLRRFHEHIGTSITDRQGRTATSVIHTRNEL